MQASREDLRERFYRPVGEQHGAVVSIKLRADLTRKKYKASDNHSNQAISIKSMQWCGLAATPRSPERW